jgi:hypothetical protein
MIASKKVLSSFIFFRKEVLALEVVTIFIYSNIN